MKRLIKDGDIVFDGIRTREQLEKRAFRRLEILEMNEELCRKIIKAEKVKVGDAIYKDCYAYYDFATDEIMITCQYDELETVEVRVDAEYYEERWWIL